MLSWRARDDAGKQLAAAGRWGGDGGCFCRSAGSEECGPATLPDCDSACTSTTTTTEPEHSQGGPAAEGSSFSGSCSSSSSNSSSSISSSSSSSHSPESVHRPMVVVQVQRAADTVSYLAVGRSRRSSLPQHRSYHLIPCSSSSSSSSFSSPVTSSSSSSCSSPVTSSSSSSSLPCSQNAVPMVALECELSVSGRLSPPAELSRTMSAPLLSAGTAGGVGDSDPHLSLGAAEPGPQPGEGGSLPGSSEHLPGSVGPTSPYPANGVSRSGSKRKLPRREDAICEDEDVEMMTHGDHNFQVSGNNLTTRGCCVEQWEDASETKKMRLDDGEAEKGRVSSDHHRVEDRGESDAPRSRNYVSGHQKVNCVVYDCLSTVSVSTNPATAGSEIPLDVVVEDSPDSVVEVDVVGDEDGGGGCQTSAHPCADSTVVDTERCSSEEASSEDGEDDAFLMTPRTPRISPFLNTPKQRKEERRKILKMSIHKMRSVEDPEHFLRRSVLINNTMKRLQRELREEKMRNNPRRSCYGLYRRASSLHYDVLNNSYLLHDEPFAVGENDRITDDMTDALVTKLEASSSPVAPTPSPSPCPLEDTDCASVMFSAVVSDSSAWPSEVSSTMPELSSHLTSTDTLPQPSLSSQEDLMSSLSPPTSDTVSTTSGEDLTSSSSSSSLPSLSSPSSSSSPSCMLYEGMFNVPNLSRDSQSPSSSCSSQSQREKQMYADMDTVFNNLIHALGDS